MFAKLTIASLAVISSEAHRNTLWEEAEHEVERGENDWVSIFPSGQSEIRIPFNLHRRNPLWEKAEHESDRTRRSNWENGRGRRVEQVWTQGEPQEYTHYETYDTQELRPVYNLCEDCGGDGALNLSWGNEPNLSDEFLLGTNPTVVEDQIQDFLNGGYLEYMEHDP